MKIASNFRQICACEMCESNEINVSQFSSKSDDKSRDLTAEPMMSEEITEQQKLTEEEEEIKRLKHQSENEVKLKHYESECKRFGLQKIKIVQRCIKAEFGSEILDISEYGIGTMQCQLMFELFNKSPATFLTLVNMKNNRIEHYACQAIASHIQTSESLKDLTLEGCKFGDEGAKVLSNGISKSISVVYLNVSNCNISDVGGEVLVESFLKNSVCEELVLASNFLALKTSKALGKVLAENITLKVLDLSYNSFYEDNAIVNVLKGLSQNEQLENLDLSWNGLSGEPFGMILSKSIKASKLKTLKMKYNRMATFELKKLALGLKYSKTINEVYIEGNFFNGEDHNLLNVFNSKSPLKMISFGKWFHLSPDAFKVI